MRFRNLLLAIFLGIVLPWLMLLSLEQKDTEPAQETQTRPPVNTEETTLTVLRPDGALTDMEMQEYLVGVVLAEMPASFEFEALKAQAVVARTFAAKGMLSGKHAQAAVCMDASCCQGYISVQQYLDNGGQEASVRRVESAVEQTCDQVLVYNGELIVATYFSCSGGRTEDAVAVWGTDVPYLQATDSPGEEQAKHYMDQVTFTLDEFETRLGAALEGGIGEITYTAGGGVDTIRIGQNTFTGPQIRQLLGLRSTAFVISVSDQTVTVTTKGFGHRVGMSQYGANAMATNGSTYDQILYYYYKGTQLAQMREMIV